MKLTAAEIARVCHEVNRAYCKATGDDSQAPWDETPALIQESAIAGVRAHLDNPSLTPEQSHELWSAHKLAEGWVYGKTKSIEKKTHPCLVPYDELPVEQRVKDYLFKAVVASLR
jgi:hypothetical protein